VFIIEEQTELSPEHRQKITLVEKLVASQKFPSKGTADSSANAAVLLKKMESLEKTESGYLDRVGRRLQTMLDAVKSARNVAKPVKQALAEAIDAYEHAKVARVEQQEARTIWLAKIAEERRKADAPGSSSVQVQEAATENSSSTNSTLRGISHGLEELRKEVKEIRDAQGMSSSMENSGTWIEVVRRKSPTTKAVNKNVDATSASGPVTVLTPAARQQRVRTRPPAIMVDATDSNDYPALVKRIKDGMDGNVVGNNITGMKQAKNGGLLLEVRGDVAAVEALSAEVAKSVGQDASVRLLQQKTMIEIRDIDAWASKEDIMDSIERETAVAKSNIYVVSLRASYGGTQTALVLLPSNQARVIVDKGRLKISVVSCRVRQAERSTMRDASDVWLMAMNTSHVRVWIAVQIVGVAVKQGTRPRTA